MNPPAGPEGWAVEPDGAAFDTSAWNERTAALYAHWRAIRPAPGLLPGRRHFDPIVLPKLLPSIWLLDVQREPLRLKYRLVGTNIVNTLGSDFTGRWFDEARPALLKVAPVYNRYRQMVETGRATWRRGTPLLTIAPHWHTTETLMMPLADDGRTVDMLLCMSVYFRHDGHMR